MMPLEGPSIELNRIQSRNVDSIAINDFGMPGVILMENAGRNCAAAILSSVPAIRSVVLVCGGGNNGGDGFVIARHLANQGIQVKVVLMSEPSSIKGDAKINYQILAKSEVSIVPFVPSMDDRDLHELLASIDGKEVDCLVDSLLGTGATGDPRPPFDRVIRLMNDLDIYRVAIDIPTGLDCDTGEIGSPTFVADRTLTFVTRKTGFRRGEAARYLGRVNVIDIGIPIAILGMARVSGF